MEKYTSCQILTNFRLYFIVAIFETSLRYWKKGHNEIKSKIYQNLTLNVFSHFNVGLFYKLSQKTLPFLAEMQFSTKKRVFGTVLHF
jgi:hypothetical protein